MKMKGLKKSAAILASASMLFLAGCETTGGVDLNKAVTEYLNVQSYEGTGSVALSVVRDETANLSAKDAVMLELLKDFKINFASIQVKDKENGYVAGEIVFSKGKIPFEIWQSKQEITIKLEGASKLIVLPNQSRLSPIVAPMGAPVGNSMLSSAVLAMQEKLTEQSTRLSALFTSFFTKHSPNPAGLTVTPVTETINNQSVSLQKIHAEVYGTDLLPIVKAMLTSIAADDQGLKELISQLYDILVPIIKDMAAAMEVDEDASPTSKMMMMYLDNKVLAVEFLHVTLKGYLEQALADFDEATDKLKKAPASEPSNPFALLIDNKDLYLKTDLYVDSSYVTRKIDLDIQIPIQDKESGVKAIQVKSGQLMSNVNGTVATKPVDNMEKLDLLQSGFSQSQVFKMLDKKSSIYQLAKELKLNREEIRMVMLSGEDGYSSSRPYINKEGYSLVPVRFVSERLGAGVGWNGSKQQVTIKEGNVEVILTIGSRTAIVNGQAIEMDTAVELTDNSTFVPARFIAEKLGGIVNWDGDTRTVTITKEY